VRFGYSCSGFSQKARRAALPVLLATFLAQPSLAADPVKFPPEGVDLSGVWQTEKTIQPVPGEKFAPVMPRGNQRGDHTNPILQPWAAAKVKENADLIDAGTPQQSSMQRCQPLGYPRLNNIPYNLSFLQEKDLITILYEFDHAVRHVYMNEEHLKDFKPNWNGHSVGRWEGDTLVIDTIGQHDKTWVDSLGTPHTDKMHVVERFRLIDDGKTLELIYTVDDPGTFTTKWSGRTTYTRYDVPLIEFVCAENNREQETVGADGISPAE